MKVVPPPFVSKAAAKARIVPVIPLDRHPKSELKKHEVLTFKLRSQPNDPTSQTYELTVPYFSTGTPEQWLLFQRDLRRVLRGQNITDGPGSYSMIRRLLEGDALSVFNLAASNNGNETLANFNNCLRSVTTHVFPARALAIQRRYMRRFLRKPQSMRTRDFVARVNELDSYLELFPPFGQQQRQPEDVLKDIFEFGVPNRWQNYMTLQGFDPLEHTVSEFVEFCERLELTEDTINDKNGPSAKTDSKSSSHGTKSSPKSSGAGATPNSNHKRKATDKFCEYHQVYGHDTGECKVVLAQARKMRASWETAHGKYASHDNKRRKIAPTATKPTQELNVLVEQALKRALTSAKSQKSKMTSNEEHLTVDDFELLQLSDDENENHNDNDKNDNE